MDSIIQSLENKVRQLDMQVSMMSLTFIEMQRKMKEMELLLSARPATKMLDAVSSDLNIDDDTSDGYESDTVPLPSRKIGKGIPKITRGEYIMVATQVSSDDSGYEDSDED